MNGWSEPEFTHMGLRGRLAAANFNIEEAPRIARLHIAKNYIERSAEFYLSVIYSDEKLFG